MIWHSVFRKYCSIYFLFNLRWLTFFNRLALWTDIWKRSWQFFECLCFSLKSPALGFEHRWHLPLLVEPRNANFILMISFIKQNINMSSLPDGVCDVNKGVDTAVVHRFPPENDILQRTVLQNNLIVWYIVKYTSSNINIF